MKKIIAILLTLITCFSLFAEYSFFNDDLTFTIAPISPLYKENPAQSFANNIRFAMNISPKDEKYAVNSVLVTTNDSEGYVELPFKDASSHNTKFWYMKSAADIALLRFEYKDAIKLEGYIHGGINTLFGAYGGVDALGFDGQYGGGINLSIFDTAILRLGIHHFSGHWGDEILNDFRERYSSPLDYTGLTEYTRNNSYYMGVNLNVLPFLTIGAEAELPERKAWIRPASHVPAFTSKPSSEESPEKGNTSGHIWKQEGKDGRNNHDYPDSYKAWRLGLNLLLSYPINDEIRIYGAYDVRFHQDGMIDITTAKYNENGKWDIEHNLALGIGFLESEGRPEFVIEVSYHNGRVPLLNYWFKHTEYLSIGVGLNF